MNTWDKILLAIIGLALVTVMVSSNQSVTAINAIANAITQLTNIVTGAKANG